MEQEKKTDPTSKKRKISKNTSEDGQHKNGIPTYNRFEVLDDDASSISSIEIDEEDSFSTAVTKKFKIPPLVITSKIENYMQFIKTILNVCQDKKTRIDYNPKKLKVFTTSIEDYGELLKLLKNENMEFYTYAPKNSRPKHIVAKRLPNIPTPEIMEDLLK
ncbi:uncharacterized protein LOC127285889 [Leptopilina boulardi]|uniref:uncharacterized protein LOC127285889 n=1 Tax=Leptopilina boulardi TaxID=63433 RepID=UPI0021F5B357|nr:uncharacterized protein LOC127285889 [Leptopilina boulardi]